MKWNAELVTIWTRSSITISTNDIWTGWKLEYTTEKLTGIFSVKQYLDCLFGGDFKRHKMCSFRSDNHNLLTRYNFHLSMTNDIG